MEIGELNSEELRFRAAQEWSEPVAEYIGLYSAIEVLQCRVMSKHKTSHYRLDPAIGYPEFRIRLTRFSSRSSSRHQSSVTQMPKCHLRGPLEFRLCRTVCCLDRQTGEDR
jgi:hypothetical protein